MNLSFTGRRISSTPHDQLPCAR